MKTCLSYYLIIVTDEFPNVLFPLVNFQTPFLDNYEDSFEKEPVIADTWFDRTSLSVFCRQ